MKILIISDSHGRNERVKEVLEKHKPIDALIHLGDSLGLEDQIEEWAECPCYMVAGNCDYFSDLPQIRIIKAEGHSIFAVHGHQLSVAQGTKRLIQEAKARFCDIAMFGHTHCPCVKREQGMLILNPGSISYPRQEGHRPTYMILTAQPDGEVKVSRYEIER